MNSVLTFGEFQALQYVAMAIIFLAVIADCLIIDAILHNERIRSGVHLVIMNWAICDLFYLLHVPGFLPSILQMIGLSPFEGTYSILRQVNHPNDLLLQSGGVLIMFAIVCSSINQDLPSINSIILYGIMLASIIINGIICTVDLEWIKNEWLVHKIFLSLCVVTLIVNELNYFCKKCDEDEKPMTIKTSLKIDVIRIYVYNWGFVYAIKFCLMSLLFAELKETPSMKIFYVICLYLTFSAFCTSIFIMMYLLHTQTIFKNNFALNCRRNKTGANSINNADITEVSSIVCSKNPSYDAVYRTYL